jgi:hypothetical protein
MDGYDEGTDICIHSYGKKGYHGGDCDDCDYKAYMAAATTRRIRKAAAMAMGVTTTSLELLLVLRLRISRLLRL